jgi:hypothetical protein
MKVSLTVPASYIAVLKLFTSKTGMLFCNGICLEIGRKEARILATDGAALGCFRLATDQPQLGAPLTTIIPSDLFQSLKQTKGQVEIIIEDVEPGGVGSETSYPVTIIYAPMCASISGKTMDIRFPDYRRVIPAEVSGEPAQFDPYYMTVLAKAGSILHGTKNTPRVSIGHNGENAALIDLGVDDFVGAIMPLRGMEPPKTCPSWIQDSLQGV